MTITKDNVTRRQLAVMIALKFDLTEFETVTAGDVQEAIENSDKVFNKTGITIGDISRSSVLDTLKKLPLPARNLGGKRGWSFTNPFYGVDPKSNA